MASMPIIHLSLILHPHPRHPSLPSPRLTVFERGSRAFLRAGRVRASGRDPLGEFGARDPFDAEIESGFAEKVLGNSDTEHKILVPIVSVLSLAQQQLAPISPSQPPLTESEALSLLRKVLGWRLVNDDGKLKLQCLWKLKDLESGLKLKDRVSEVAEAAGQFPTIHLEEPNQVRVELWTEAIGGLSMNDFILAAKIGEIQTSDLVPRKRVWA